MRKLALLSVLSVLFVPALADAQVNFGLRLGYALAMGEAGEGDDLSDGIKGQIPVQLDLGFKVTPALTLGGYFGYGFGRLGDEFEDCDDCSARVYRLGAQLEYTFGAPWLGAGIGYEWASISNDAVDAKMSFRGFEYLNVQGGMDWNVGDKVWVGPFAMITFGQYSTVSTENIGVPGGDIEDKGFHEWVQIGIRGRFSL